MFVHQFCEASCSSQSFWFPSLHQLLMMEPSCDFVVFLPISFGVVDLLLSQSHLDSKDVKLGFLHDQVYLLETTDYRTVSDTAHFLRKVKGMIKKTNALQIVRHIYLNSLPKKKVSSMCSFTSNMNNDITLQTKGSSICLAIEEGCIYPDSSS